jgi:hypothetical protein
MESENIAYRLNSIQPEGRNLMGCIEELRAIPGLAATGEALAAYAKSLIPEADFTKKGRQWVCKPNFIAFEVQSTRAKQITFTIYGLRHHSEKYPILPFRMGRSSYLRFAVNTPRQLGAATAYIAHAAGAWARKHHHPEWAQKVDQF